MATGSSIEATVTGGEARLMAQERRADGPARPPGRAGGRGTNGGSGPANLTTWVQAAGGHLAAHRAGTRFELTADILLPITEVAGAGQRLRSEPSARRSR